MNKNVLYLLTIISAIEKINLFKKDFSNSKYFANSKLNFNAILNLLLAIGEEIRKIDERLKIESGYSSWSDIVGLRNNLAHNYRGVDKDIVWETINNDLCPLKNICISMLKSIKPNREDFEEIINKEYYEHISYLLNDLYS